MEPFDWDKLIRNADDPEMMWLVAISVLKVLEAGEDEDLVIEIADIFESYTDEDGLHPMDSNTVRAYLDRNSAAVKTAYHDHFREANMRVIK